MDNEFPQIDFGAFDERCRIEVAAKGYLGSVRVIAPCGSVYFVTFYDSFRLAQELEDETTVGRPFLADPGMIVLKSVTVENMTAAINALFKSGFFNALKSER